MGRGESSAKAKPLRLSKAMLAALKRAPIAPYLNDLRRHRITHATIYALTDRKLLVFRSIYSNQPYPAAWYLTRKGRAALSQSPGGEG